MDGDSKNFPNDGIRVSDADRDQAVTELSEHFQTGRLTHDEFEERSGQALQARTGSDLRRLFTDLPSRAALGKPLLAAPGPVPGLQRGRPFPRIIPLIIAAFIVTSMVGHGAGVVIPMLLPVVILVLLALATRVSRRR